MDGDGMSYGGKAIVARALGKTIRFWADSPSARMEAHQLDLARLEQGLPLAVLPPVPRWRARVAKVFWWIAVRIDPGLLPSV